MPPVSPAPTAPTLKKGLGMTTAPHKSIPDSPPEPLIIFDCRGPRPKNRLHRERRAWGSAATVENLGYGRAVLVVRPGSALELTR
jgi:hypothetical protein